MREKCRKTTIFSSSKLCVRPSFFGAIPYQKDTSGMPERGICAPFITKKILDL
jgi:hypothetical protein